MGKPVLILIGKLVIASEDKKETSYRILIFHSINIFSISLNTSKIYTSNLYTCTSCVIKNIDSLKKLTQQLFTESKLDCGSWQMQKLVS